MALPGLGSLVQGANGIGGAEDLSGDNTFTSGFQFGGSKLVRGFGFDLDADNPVIILLLVVALLIALLWVVRTTKN